MPMETLLGIASALLLVQRSESIKQHLLEYKFLLTYGQRVMQKVDLTQYTSFGAQCPYCPTIAVEVFDGEKRVLAARTCIHWKGIGRSGKARFMSDEERNRYMQRGKLLEVKADGSLYLDGALLQKGDE